ncbi:MAG: FkbM family methyltransferase [Patescibacteria group bacterium]|nr:FkbM family methyltransferase [Patescibacteria group bacterium]
MRTIKRFIRSILARLNIDIDSHRPRKEYVVDQKKLMPSPRIIFDVGGHMGQTIEKYGKLYPNTLIYTFEPFVSSFVELAKRCAAQGNCRPFQLAFSDSKGFSDYFANASGGGTNSLFPPEDMEKRFDHDDDSHYAGTTKTTVRTDTIDSFCEEHGIDHIDILKMDIQGGELKALRGAVRMFREQKVSLVFLEVSFIHIYKDQALFHDVEEFLVAHGYTLYNLHYLSTQSRGQIVQGDAIFVNRELAKKFNLDTATKSE